MDEMEKEQERARENERETLYMPHNSLKMSEAGGAQEIGPHTASACVCSPGPHPGPLDERLERRTIVSGPRESQEGWLCGRGEPHLGQGHRPNVLCCTDITLLLLRVFRASDTGYI